MKLYEFELYNNKITVEEYEIKETEKLYIIQRQGSKKSFIDYNALTRIPKYIVDGEVQTSYKKAFFYSLSNDIENAKKSFIEYLQTKKIPQCENAIQEANKKLNEYKNILERLINSTEI